MHLHALGELGLAEVQLSLFADALLPLLFLLFNHLVENENGTSSWDWVCFELRFPQVVRQVLLWVSLLLQLVSLVEAERPLLLLGESN
jgi:hypothetical protein